MTTRLELLAHLAALADRGHVAPCLIVPNAAWTADNHAEQCTAAALCRRCPALAPCREYGLTHPTEHGVYGALTGAMRHPADVKRRPRTSLPTDFPNGPGRPRAATPTEARSLT